MRVETQCSESLYSVHYRLFMELLIRFLTLWSRLFVDVLLVSLYVALFVSVFNSSGDSILSVFDGPVSFSTDDSLWVQDYSVHLCVWKLWFTLLEQVERNRPHISRDRRTSKYIEITVGMQSVVHGEAMLYVAVLDSRVVLSGWAMWHIECHRNGIWPQEKTHWLVYDLFRDKYTVIAWLWVFVETNQND